MFQGGDSRFDGRERVKYTREQLLELKEVIISVKMYRIKARIVSSVRLCSSLFEVTDVSAYVQTTQLSDEILRVQRETATELFGEEETWARGESVVSNLVLFC